METIIDNAKIYIERGTFAEAAWISDGLVRMIGTNEEVRTAAPHMATVIDAYGRTVLPGMNDSHLHLGYVGESLSYLDLSQANSIWEILAMAEGYRAFYPEATKYGLYGVGWNQETFSTGEKRMPTRRDLDRISKKIPIVIERVCGHIAVGNSRAIEMAGITPDTPFPEGGGWEIVSGELNGLFKGTAKKLVTGVFPPTSVAELKEYYKTAMEHAARVGITSVQSNDAREETAKDVFQALRELDREGRMTVRFRHQVTFSDPQDFRDFLKEEHGDPAYRKGMLRMGPLKLFKDGSLGARTALMRNEYRDDPGNYGVSYLANERMDELCAIAAESGVQVVIHAIGDGAIELVLDAYEKVIPESGNVLRHSLNHCQITDRPLLERIARLDVAALMQPIFLNTDLHMVTQRVGEELASTSYALRTMDELGIHAAYGTDAPVESYNPFPCIYTAVTRQDLRGIPAGGFYPEERVDLEATIDHYTVGSAYVESQEDVKGRLKPGYYADLIVLDRDIFTVPEDEIKDIEVLLTMVNGKIVYEQDLKPLE